MEKPFKPRYELTILCVDGDTAYVVGSSDKKLLSNFLDEHDHEGSTVYLEQSYQGIIVNIPYNKIYDELKEEKHV